MGINVEAVLIGRSYPEGGVKLGLELAENMGECGVYLERSDPVSSEEAYNVAV